MTGIFFVIMAGLVRTLAGSNSTGYLDGVGSNARFMILTDVDIDSLGILYVVDKKINAIRRISSSGN